MTAAKLLVLASGLTGLGCVSLSVACWSRADHHARLADAAADRHVRAVEVARAARLDRWRQDWLAAALGFLAFAAAVGWAS